MNPTDPRDAWPRRYGGRALIGAIAPPSNTSAAIECARFAPAGVAVTAMRMPLHIDADAPDFEAALARDLDAAVDLIAPARPDVIVYACTASSMASDEAALAARIASRAGVPAATTAGAILAALTALGIRRLALATPYVDRLSAHEAAWLDARGFPVAAWEGLGIGETAAEFRLLSRVPAEETTALCARVAAAANGADGLLLSCTDLPALDLIGRLEADLGLPVVTSNQATLWRALRLAGIDDCPPGLGRLMTL